MIQCPKAQCVHDRHRPGTHRDNVANNAANAGCSTLEGLHKAWVVVALYLERDGPTLADVDNAGVFAHPHHEVFLHGVGDFLAKLPQVDLGGFIRAVLAPHHRIHRQFTRGGPATQQRPNFVVFVALETEGLKGLLLLRSGLCVAHAIEDH